MNYFPMVTICLQNIDGRNFQIMRENYYVESDYVSRFFTRCNVITEVSTMRVREFMNGLSISNTISLSDDCNYYSPTRSHMGLVANILLISRDAEDTIYLLDEYIITDYDRISLPGGCVSTIDFELAHPSSPISPLQGENILYSSICRSLYEKTTRGGYDSYYARCANSGLLSISTECKNMYNISPIIPETFYYSIEPSRPNDYSKESIIIYVPALLNSVDSVMLKHCSRCFIPVTRTDYSFMERHMWSYDTLRTYFNYAVSGDDIRVSKPSLFESIFKSSIFNL